eukprot:CAMPEP_0171058698 /NCGR_PEP_ID=MMETSP0766_2-20121228/2672_1 /TAXON_ID=439317 /ORGANISM="Gambierdiscus australes, Strain CAWD 149" /LENGTH=96 /DNA_ID=CAMNT_0011514015 /DNA_START=135 /DNA_END=421 /DNA_ORIENTATION=+
MAMNELLAKLDRVYKRHRTNCRNLAIAQSLCTLRGFLTLPCAEHAWCARCVGAVGARSALAWGKLLLEPRLLALGLLEFRPLDITCHPHELTAIIA